MAQKIKKFIVYISVIWFMMNIIGFVTMFADICPEPSFMLLFFPYHIIWNIVFFTITMILGNKILGKKTTKLIVLLMFLFLITVGVSYLVFMPYNSDYYEY